MNYDEAKKKLDGFQVTMLNRMIETARHGEKLISYTDLILDSGVVLKDPNVRKAMSAVLDSIAREIVKQNGIMLTAVVVSRTNSVPSRGFYDLATRLDKLPPNSPKDVKEEFWRNELKKVQQYYQKVKTTMNGKEAKEKLDGFQVIMLNRMIETARHGESLIFYSDLIRGSGVEDFLKLEDVRNSISAALDSIALEIVEQNGIMLTAVVVSRMASVPGKGFYGFAARLGKLQPNSSEDDEKAFWISELKKVRQYYQ